MTRDPLLSLSRLERDRLREWSIEALQLVTDDRDAARIRWFLDRLNEVDRVTGRLTEGSAPGSLNA